MSPEWSWYEWTWIAEIFESVVGPIILTLGTFALWKRTRSQLLAWATVGFVLAALGGAYHTYAYMYAGAICGSGPSSIADIQRFSECSNLHGAYGNVVGTVGMLVAGVLFLIYASRK